jgi:hypothetical protein
MSLELQNFNFSCYRNPGACKRQKKTEVIKAEEITEKKERKEKQNNTEYMTFNIGKIVTVVPEWLLYNFRLMLYVLHS